MNSELQNVIDIRDGFNTVTREIISVISHDLPSSGYFLRSEKVVKKIDGIYSIGTRLCYDTIVDLALNYWPMSLIDGHGNFSFFPAAPQFSECRSSSFLDDIVKGQQITDVNRPLDITLPYLLFRGTPGYYYSSTKIPPHGFFSTLKATLFLIMNPEATTQDLITIMNGPQTYIGGIIINSDELPEIYEKGFGEIHYSISRKSLNPCCWDSIKDTCKEYCNWYGYTLTKPEGAKKGYYEFTIKYNALFSNGTETRYYSLKEIIQSFIDNYRAIIEKDGELPLSAEALCRSLLSEVEKKTKVYRTDINEALSQYLDNLLLQK